MVKVEELSPLSPEENLRVVTALLSLGTTEGILLADLVNQHFGASARVRAERNK